jgi:hypothetical protein
MNIKARHLLDAHQAMQAFSRAMMPYAIDSMGTDKSFYNVYREHADRLATVGAPLKVYAEMAIKDIELEIDHE